MRPSKPSAKSSETEWTRDPLGVTYVGISVATLMIP